MADTDDAKLRELTNTLFRTLMTRDVAAMQAILDAESVIIHTTGRQETGLQFSEALKTRPETVTHDPVDLTFRIEGDVAIGIGRVDMKLARGPAPADGFRDVPMRVSDVWLRRPSGWKLAHHQATGIAPPVSS